LFKDHFIIIGIARRSESEAGIPYHPNIFWIQWDISTKTLFHQVYGYILGKGGADYFIHLAGYYDYDYKDHPEYRRTNIRGTENILELARLVRTKQFIFASSLTVCRFRPKGELISESNEPDATFYYALSKSKGESMLKEYQAHYKCSVVRLAAVYSDWCEFAPLYTFLSCWLAKGWDSRFLAGKGQSAMTYIHIHDICRLVFHLIKRQDELPQYGVYLGSPKGKTSHDELFRHSTRYYYGIPLRPLYIPKILTYPGLLVKQMMGYIRIIKKPHERFWMLKYIDLCLDVENSMTCSLLEWEPTPRYDILRRLPFLLDHMKSSPNVWYTKNQAALSVVSHRPNWTIYEILVTKEEALINTMIQQVYAIENFTKFNDYSRMAENDLHIHLSTLYHLLLASIRNSERGLMIRHIDEVILEKFAEGIGFTEIDSVLMLIDKTVTDELYGRKELSRLRQEIYDLVSLTLQLTRDEVEDIYGNLENKLQQYRISGVPVVVDQKKRDEMIRKLSIFYQEMPEEES
jgi:nucleoside-diphosphate-sugar epimerase